ncbi:MAG: HAD family phosphatase [Candidatus Moraniibacteriota bacterium]|nr:MAG: HAD family phosphatase [Candidatus Moranbacteria bacterium]
MSTRITTFIFDCFGVVCSPVLNTWYREHSTKYDFIDENLQETFKQFDLGFLSEDDMLDYFLQYPNIISDKAQLRREIDSYLTIDKDLVEIIKKLKRDGSKTILLSNANNAFFERKVYTQYPEFKSLFTEVIISSAVGMVKPDSEIYLHALDLAKSKPEESLFIDDSEPNVDAAIALGIKGFVYSDCASFADYLSGITIDTDAQCKP